MVLSKAKIAGRNKRNKSARGSDSERGVGERSGGNE